jgi:hypothetical protein
LECTQSTKKQQQRIRNIVLPRPLPPHLHPQHGGGGDTRHDYGAQADVKRRWKQQGQQQQRRDRGRQADENENPDEALSNTPFLDKLEKKVEHSKRVELLPPALTRKYVFLSSSSSSSFFLSFFFFTNFLFDDSVESSTYAPLTNLCISTAVREQIPRVRAQVRATEAERRGKRSAANVLSAPATNVRK